MIAGLIISEMDSKEYPWFEDNEILNEVLYTEVSIKLLTKEAI